MSRFCGLFLAVMLSAAAMCSVRSDIDRQYHRWAKAALDNDVETVLAILAPDYSLRTFTGKMIDRKAYETSLRKRRESKQAATVYQTKLASVDVHGATATVISDETSDKISLDPVTNKKLKMIHIHRYLDTWIRSGRIWKLRQTITQLESTKVVPIERQRPQTSQLRTSTMAPDAQSLFIQSIRSSFDKQRISPKVKC